LENKLDLQKIREIGNLEFLSRQLVEGFITGLHKSPYHGFSVEFLEHRLFNEGESTRNIDWKVFARTDRLYAKRFEEETNLRCVIALDNSSSMYYPEKSLGKITFSIVAAAALCYMLQKQRDAFGISIFSDQIEWSIGEKSTSTHLYKILAHLEQMLISGENKRSKQTRTSEVLHHLADSIHKRSLVVLFSDMLFTEEDPSDFFKALQHLKHNKHEVILFNTLHYPTEIEFEFDERPHLFIDVESGESVKIKPENVKEVFKDQIQKHLKEIKSWCAKARIDFVEVNIEQDVNQVLLAYITKRARMR
jgi:uncharacterized protein (DUF58 family)